MQKTLKEHSTDVYFTPKALAHRWSVTLHTLEQWRWKGRGPHFFKAGGCVRYPREEIERFETDGTHTPAFDVMDKRFLCIDLEDLMSTERLTQRKGCGAVEENRKM